MALTTLLSGIQQEAQKEIDAILGKARAEAQQIEEQARREATVEAETLHSALLSRCRNQATQKVSQARLNARKSLLISRQSLISQLQDAVLRKLEEMPDQRYRKWLAGLVLEACQSGEEELIVAETDRRRLNAAWLKEINAELRQQGKAGKLKIRYQKTADSAGCIIRHQDYEVVIDFVDMIRTLIAQDQKNIMRLLFEDSIQVSVLAESSS